ncbi:unnamed protein product [Arctogadus glacialis]
MARPSSAPCEADPPTRAPLPLTEGIFCGIAWRCLAVSLPKVECNSNDGGITKVQVAAGPDNDCTTTGPCGSHTGSRRPGSLVHCMHGRSYVYSAHT